MITSPPWNVKKHGGLFYIMQGATDRIIAFVCAEDDARFIANVPERIEELEEELEEEHNEAVDDYNEVEEELWALKEKYNELRARHTLL